MAIILDSICLQFSHEKNLLFCFTASFLHTIGWKHLHIVFVLSQKFSTFNVIEMQLAYFTKVAFDLLI